MTWNRCRIAGGALLCAVLLSMVGAPAAAQETTGTISGSVTDQTGAVLPGATVMVRHVQTGRTTEVVSNESGRYNAAFLQPGTYELTFSLSGFQPVVLKNVELHVNDRLDINQKLGVSQVSETVEVSAASQFVQPSPSVQSLLGPEQVQELPLNNRNFVQLATLVPGVSSDLGDEVGIGLTSTISISINGGRRNAVNWLVDGVSNVDVGSNVTLLATPTLESIQEFKIITSSYAAEWPRSGGGIVNIVTKSGGRSFAGTAYEFYRNDSLNANTFFRKLSTNPEIRDNPADLKYNNFGYTIGGPVPLRKDRFFFFFSEEWRRINRSTSVTVNVPQPAWLTDPTNANYVAPALRDPNAVRLLQAWPAPNASVAGVPRFINTNPNINNTRQEVLRLDYDVSGRHRLTGRYTHDLSETREIGGLFFNIVVPNVGATDTKVPGNIAALEMKSTLGQSLNEFKYQLSGNKITTIDPPDNRNRRADYGLTIPELFPENNNARIPTMVVAGLSTFGANQGFNIEYWNHTLTDNVTLPRGNHTFKAGAMAAFEQKNENANNETQGRFTFNAGGGLTAFQNFLTGNSAGTCAANCTYSESQNEIFNRLRFQRYEMFVQDTWHIRPNVTLDFGVRYALYPPVKDKGNVLTNFDPSRYDPARVPTFTSATGGAILVNTGDPLNGIVVAGDNSPHGRGIYALDKNNFQPRIGFSWDPTRNGLTIVRAAYGVYYDQPLVGMFEQNAFVNPPFANTVAVQNISLSGLAQPANTSGVRNLIASSDPFTTPRMQQWNVGVQRQLYRRGFMDVSYVGSRGDDLIQPVDINQPQPADVVRLNSLNLARPYLGYGTITMRQTTARSRYWGLLTQFRHEAGRAGSVTLNYTLSRNRTTSTNDRDAIDIPQNPLDLDIEYADARTDRRHIFSATYIYEVPFFRNSSNTVLKAALGGWQVSGITNLHSGAPIPRITANTNGGRRGGRANQVGDPREGELDFPFWFDPTAFAPPADGTYGNSVRAPFRLPGRNQTDLALSKNFYPLGRRLQFRSDFINAFNRTQYLAVDAACSAANTVTLNRCDIGGTDTFGQITSTRLPREIQLSLKLFW
jgi:hypothetical protein